VESLKGSDLKHAIAATEYKKTNRLQTPSLNLPDHNTVSSANQASQYAST